MKLSTRQLRRIILEEKRKLRRNRHSLREMWGGGKDEYKRHDGHRSGDVDHHYKDYEQPWGGDKGDIIRGPGGSGWGEKPGDEAYINEEDDWGGDEDDYSRRMGDDGHRHRTGDHETSGDWMGKYGQGGHYKDYMSESDEDLEEEWGSGRELEDPMADDMGGAMHTEGRRISKSRLRKIIMQEVRKALRRY